MGVKVFICAILLLLLIGCAGKTKPVITDLDASSEESQEEVLEETEEETTEEVDEDVVEEEVEEEELDVTEGVIVEEEDEEEGNIVDGEEQEEAPIGTHFVTIKDLRLDPQQLTINKGDTVVWKNDDEWESDGPTKHYLVAHGNEFRSAFFFTGETFEHTFNETGEFTYIDAIYNDRDYMRGTIIVE